MTRKDSQITIDLILANLPGTATEISKATGLESRRVWRWLTSRDGELWHLSKMVLPEHGGPYAGYYEVGPKPPYHCVTKQKPQAASVATKKYRSRLRKSGEWQDVKAKERARYWLRKKPKPHPLMMMYAQT